MKSGAIEKFQFKRPESILLVVYTAAGQTLLLNRIPPRSFWQSVTGSLLWPDESPPQAAVRELKEETGISSDTDKLEDWKRTFTYSILAEFLYKYEAGVTQNLEHMFSIEVPKVEPIEILRTEHVDYCWTGFDKAIDMVWSWSNREALQLVKTRIEQQDYQHGKF